MLVLLCALPINGRSGPLYSQQSNHDLIAMFSCVYEQRQRAVCSTSSDHAAPLPERVCWLHCLLSFGHQFYHLQHLIAVADAATVTLRQPFPLKGVYSNSIPGIHWFGFLGGMRCRRFKLASLEAYVPV